MGVPKFYRWISERYPQINQMLSGTTILPEFDNFYLDMNGIIHACTHPNDNSTANSLTLREMMLAIFRYIDHMVTEIVKPKKILFMAIDGVAPRAKLNQQRARRFRAAQERQESIMKARQKGETVDEENLFDSNCITPGTEFMEQVGKHLRYFIRKKIKEDPLWRNLKVVFSGHDVPGEGEHKIMQFMRDLRADPNYEPNQRHCMYGQDADLIMLGLATHEPHFALLREVVDFNANRGGGSARQTVLRQTKNAQFQLLHLSILREYLSLDFAFGSTWAPDQERLFDDFILLTFLVGNDFLPHLPSLDISEQAFDVLIGAYRQLMAEEPGYIVHNGEIDDLVRLEKLFAIIGSQESSILKAREEDVKAFNQKRRKFKDAAILSEEELEEAEERMQLAFETALNIAMGKDSSSSEGEEGEGEGGSQEGAGFGLDKYGDYVAEEAWVGVQKSMPTAVSRGKGKGKKNNGQRAEGEEEDAGVSKDYSGRYYYEKFAIVASSDKGKVFMSELMAHYLKGLMWCLAYYIKGCISWTWYYPYHYGPMLKDMTGLVAISEKVCFDLGNPFMPFQQLLGCLPPASCNLLPRPYQWLMVSVESPVLHFYPVDFGIDQDGKKNPWEAVVLLDFIDEKKLMAAEALHCPANKLTKTEAARNEFGHVLTYLFDPGMVETYPSCNPEINLPDIPACQSTVSESYPSLAPGCYFKAELVSGTVYPIAGFPSLTILPLQGMKTEAAKVNMFGSESKYRSVILEIKSPEIQNVDDLNAELLLGRIVYVNYPQVHEAKVVAVTTVKEEVRIVNGLPQRTRFDSVLARQWSEESEEEEGKYLKGRGTPGSGGLRIGKVAVRLRVAPLQGLQRDPNTGASKKVFSAKEEADIPIQMALWTPPVADTRFAETAEMTLEELMPYNAEVVALTGDLLGCKGRIVGPHGPESSSEAARLASKRSSLKEDIVKDQTAVSSSRSVGKKRVVDVQFTLNPPEPPFGYSIATSIKEEFYTSKDLCALLQVSPSVLGKIVGMIRVEPGRADLGLNLKRNGQYQLLGYSQRVDYSTDGGDPAAAQFKKRKVWGGVDTVEIVGMVSGDNGAADKAAEVDAATWQYSARAAALIYDYKTSFPYLFSQLERLPHQPVYSPEALLGHGGAQVLEQVQEWMKSQPFFKLPRTPFTTTSLPKDAMAAIERAADVQVSKRNSGVVESATVVVKSIPVQQVFCSAHRSVGDVALTFNRLEPKLGDRVVNLTCPGVPFGFKGTVVTIHSSTKFVELIFDEEFIGGKGLQGSCSQFRGRLAPWSDLLLVSRTDEFQEFKRAKAAAGKVAPASASGAGGAPPKKGSAVLSPQQAKPILQRPTASKASYAAAANAPAPAPIRSDADGKPLLQQSGNVGQKLLKALQKEGKDKVATPSPASKVAILKKKIGVPDKVEVAHQPPDAPSAQVPASNGTGINILAQAAGYSAVDMSSEQALLPSAPFQHPMMGVISYQAQQSMGLNMSSLTIAPTLPTPPPPVAAPAAPSRAHPPAVPKSAGHSQQQGSPQRQRAQPTGSKLVLNKDATKRIVAHELKPNAAPTTTPATSIVHTTTHTSAHTKPSADGGEKEKGHSDATTAGAALLATMNKPKVKKATAEHPPSTATTEHQASAEAPAPAPHAAAAPAMTMAEKLANAKKMMKEKQQKMLQMKNSEHGAAEEGAAAHHAPAVHHPPVAADAHPKEVKPVAPKEVKPVAHKKAPAAGDAPQSITAILTKAKHAATSSAAAASTTEAAAAESAAVPEAHQSPAAAKKQVTKSTPAPVPHHAAPHHAAAPAPAAPAASVSITALLKNAKRAPAAAAPPGDETAAAPAQAESATPAAVAAPSTVPAVSPSAVLKKKPASSLVPSKVLISKK